MRRALSLGVLAAAVLAAACGDPSGVSARELYGFWGAVELEYVSQSSPADTVDLVRDLGGNYGIELISGGGFAAELNMPGQPTVATSGTFAVDGDRLTLQPTGLPDQEFRFTFDEIFLTLRDATASYDFDGDGTAEPASLRILLDRF